MPIDIKATTQSCLFQKRKRHYSAERASKLKLRRHDVYANQSADKKEMLLAQRRSKNIESTSQGLLFEHIEVASSSETAAELPRQRILTIGESCCLDEKADKSCADDTTVCSNKGKNIIGSVSVFEYGSTSNPLDERRDPEVSVVIKRGYHNQKYCRGNKDYCCKLMGMETTNEITSRSSNLQDTLFISSLKTKDYIESKKKQSSKAEVRSFLRQEVHMWLVA
ncbi:uncharacterized protein LOC107798533 isoform X4 [Nicotiana tabacum]|uniref:Uncharacterized protein LOC107798533 isoform X4 n=2 Tax=Nicotiana TaxID=4085 RepID=A0AC58S3L9_TOBAC|nr:PREDICTED: uncharacterized protein LOC104250114 isoform X3 [Nicotiana sylvestris]